MSAVEHSQSRFAGGRWLGRERWWLALIVVVAATVYAVASVRRYTHLGSGLDLSIFAQAVWHYSHFQAPFSTLKSEDILGDHFHPLVAGLAVLYWLWRDPRTLLLAQAMLVALSAVPVFLFARSRLPGAAALLIAAAYVSFWGLQVGVTFDFHELAFAPLLIAGALLAADRQRFGLCWLASGLLLLVKEDMSFVVVFLGVLLLTRREYRHGLAMIVTGIAFYELATRVVIPHFAYTHTFGYWSYQELGSNPLSAVWALIKAPWRLFSISVSPGVKAGTLLALFAPFLFTSLGSPLMLIAVPLLLERFLSTNPNYWGMDYHYSLAVAPVLAMSSADGMANLAGLWRRRVSRGGRYVGAVLITAGAVMLVANLVIARQQTPTSAIALVTGRAHYLPAAQITAADRALVHVPADAAVAAPTNLGAHLADRPVIEDLTITGLDKSQYLVADVTAPSCCSEVSSAATIGLLLDQVLPDLTPVFYDDGWIVARRPASGRAVSSGVMDAMPRGPSRRLITAVSAWHTALFRVIEHIPTCVGILRGPAAGRGSGPACFAAGQPGLVARSRAVDVAAGAAGAHMTGGCAQLRRASDHAITNIAADLTAIDNAGQTGSLLAVARAYVTFEAHETSADRIGLVDRFLILCTQRRHAGSV